MQRIFGPAADPKMTPGRPHSADANLATKMASWVVVARNAPGRLAVCRRGARTVREVAPGTTGAGLEDFVPKTDPLPPLQIGIALGILA